MDLLNGKSRKFKKAMKLLKEVVRDLEIDQSKIFQDYESKKITKEQALIYLSSIGNQTQTITDTLHKPLELMMTKLDEFFK